MRRECTRALLILTSQYRKLRKRPCQGASLRLDVDAPARDATKQHEKDQDGHGRKDPRAGTVVMERRQKAIQAESNALAAADAGLVHRAKTGDETACRGIVDHYADGLYGLACSLLGDRTAAADVVQETFSGAFRRIRDFEERASLKTWLTRILVRQVARHHRTERKFRAVSLSRLKELPGKSDASAAAADPAGLDARMDVTAALEKLSPLHREVLVLREYQGLSYEEIASVLDVPRGTVESRLFRARREMRTQLRDYATDASETDKG